MGMGTALTVLYKFWACRTPILKGWSPTLEGGRPANANVGDGTGHPFL